MRTRATRASLEVFASSQRADLWVDSRMVRRFVVSTAKNGLGCSDGSYCTPTGKLAVVEKIGAGQPLGTVFRGREPTGEVWQAGGDEPPDQADEDLVLTRILWLGGTEPANANTKQRFIYLHGTNHERELGTPASHGCIRLANADIIELFDWLRVGDIVRVRA